MKFFFEKQPILSIILVISMLFSQTFIFSAAAIDSIIIDGRDNEWGIAEQIAVGENSENKLYAAIIDSDLYILVKSNNINDYRIFLSTPAANIGYSSSAVFRGQTIKYMIANESLYHFNENTDSSGKYLKSTTRIMVSPNNGSVIECKIPLSGLNITSKQSVSIGFVADFSNFEATTCIPDINGQMAVLIPQFIGIPSPLGIAVSDLGINQHGNQYKPWVSRYAALQDYANLADVAKLSGTRMLTGWVMQDLDKEGITINPAKNPPKTPSYLSRYGLQPHYVNSDYTNSIMNFMKDRAANLELGMQGVSDGYFYNQDGVLQKKNGEWANIVTRKRAEPYSDDDIKNKADAFLSILRQYYNSEISSFPVSMLPADHAYYTSEQSNHTTSKLLSPYGIKNAAVDLTETSRLEESGKIDDNIMLLNMAPNIHADEPHFTPISSEYIYPEDGTSWIETAFTNYWEAERNPVLPWVSYIRGINSSFDRMLAVNTKQLGSQWIYYNYAKSSYNGRFITIDTNEIPDAAYNKEFLIPLTLKINLQGRHLSTINITNGARFFSYCEDEFGFGYVEIGTPENTNGALSKGVYDVSYTLSDELPVSYINRENETYTVYDFLAEDGFLFTELEIYGTQSVDIKLPFKPTRFSVDNNKVEILESEYDNGALHLELRGKNIQGERAVIRAYSDGSTEGEQIINEEEYPLNIGRNVIYTEGMTNANPHLITMNTADGDNIGFYYYYDDNTKNLVVVSPKMTMVTLSSFNRRFEDLDGIDWAIPSIYALASRRIIDGTSGSTYTPHENVTRAQAVKMAVSAFNIKGGENTGLFWDVDPGSWAAPYVKAARCFGILDYYTSSNFNPDEYISRQEIATIFYRASNLANVKFKIKEELIFNDRDQFAPYAIEPVRMLSSTGVINGVGNDLFAPTANATRAEAAKILYLLYLKKLD